MMFGSPQEIIDSDNICIGVSSVLKTDLKYISFSSK